ncbi:MAG TPA: helix-turn-helix domain-containing protein [Novosphingobium sp.]
MNSAAASANDFEGQDRRVRKTRVAIRSAVKRLLARDGLDQFTIKDIAEEADIGYTTFFRHFPSKEAALADLADSVTTELLERTLPLLHTANSRESCLALCRYIDANRPVWEALLTGGAAGYVRAALAEHTFERSQEWPASQSWIPADKGTYLATGMVVEILTWWLTHAATLAPEAVAEIMDRTFISALVGKR